MPHGSLIGTAATVDKVMVIGYYYDLVELDWRLTVSSTTCDLIFASRRRLLIETSCLGMQVGIAHRFAIEALVELVRVARAQALTSLFIQSRSRYLCVLLTELLGRL